MTLLRSMVEQYERDCMGAGFQLTAELVRRFIASLLTKRFVILTGLSGSGKTKLAQAFARWITPPQIHRADPFEVGALIPADRIKYYVNAADRLSVEFWNTPDEANATKVVLPRELIQEWATFISANGLSDSTSARQIREGVAATTKFSAQLNSFETHFKAAAFALLNAESVASSHRCYEVVAVGADWTSNEQIMGYLDGLDKSRYVRTRVLDLVLRAQQQPMLPHFLILDEMNLSHVERYFADLLSAIESGEPLHLHSAQDEFGQPTFPSGVPREVELASNLFIIGTVNVDETTYSFSPKVLDRANVIEFRVTEAEMEGFVTRFSATNLEALNGKGEAYIHAFVKSDGDGRDLTPTESTYMEAELLLFFSVLKDCHCEFGYRTAKEIGAFIKNYKSLSNSSWEIRLAFDVQVNQKLLPKLHGSRAKLEPVLCALAAICFEKRESDDVSAQYRSLRDLAARAIKMDNDLDPLRTRPDGTPAFQSADAFYPSSHEKLVRMLEMLRYNGFTSFAEA